MHDDLASGFISGLNKWNKVRVQIKHKCWGGGEGGGVVIPLGTPTSFVLAGVRGFGCKTFEN